MINYLKYVCPIKVILSDKFYQLLKTIVSFSDMTSVQFQTLVKRVLNKLHRLKNLIFLFLELHMLKIVFLFAMLTCVFDKCALYIFIVILISLSFTFGRPMQLFTIYASSIFVSILLIARMIYQVQYITPDEWNVTCTVSTDTFFIYIYIGIIFKISGIKYGK